MATAADVDVKIVSLPRPTPCSWGSLDHVSRVAMEPLMAALFIYGPRAIGPGIDDHRLRRGALASL